MRAAAVVPTPPLLVPEVAGGSAGRYADLRQACDDAVAALVASGPADVVVVGTAPRTGELSGSWDWRGFGVVSPADPVASRLPLALGIGAWLLDRSGWKGPRRFVGVRSDTAVEECAALGRALPADALLLVCGDGAATLDEKAPGHLHPDAAAWEGASAAALRSGRAAALLQLAPARAAEVLASGRAGWQVLAGAAGGAEWVATALHSSSPHGVAYHVVTWLTPYEDETKKSER